MKSATRFFKAPPTDKMGGVPKNKKFRTDDIILMIKRY